MGSSGLSATAMLLAPPPRNEGRFCRARTGEGKPCRAYRMKGRLYCHSHDPETRNEVIAQLEAGRPLAIAKSKQYYKKRRAAIELSMKKPDPSVLRYVPKLKSAQELRDYLAEILPLVLMGCIPPPRTRPFLEILKVAAATFKGEIFPPVPPQVDLEDGDYLGEAESEVEIEGSHPLEGMTLEDLGIADSTRPGPGRAQSGDGALLARLSEKTDSLPSTVDSQQT